MAVAVIPATIIATTLRFGNTETPNYHFIFRNPRMATNAPNARTVAIFSLTVNYS